MGRWRSYSTNTTDDMLSIDLADLKRRGILVPGNSKTMTWSRGGERVASISMACGQAGLRLMYRTGDGSVDEMIPFTWTRTNFGGRRQWFEYPRCRRPKRVLYGGARFRCRKCYGLHYASQYESPGLGAVEQAEKIRRRLGDKHGSAFDGDGFPDKPKGMHWSTYRRLEERYEDLQNRWAVAAMRKFGFRGLGD